MASRLPSRHRDPKGSIVGSVAAHHGGIGDEFSHTVTATIDYIKAQWPSDLANLSVEIHSVPPPALALTGLPRWSVFRDRRTIWLYRLPIERLSKLHKRDAWHRRVLVESIVISAIAELLGTDPWHLAPDRFHPH